MDQRHQGLVARQLSSKRGYFWVFLEELERLSQELQRNLVLDFISSKGQAFAGNYRSGGYGYIWVWWEHWWGGECGRIFILDWWRWGIQKRIPRRDAAWTKSRRMRRNKVVERVCRKWGQWVQRHRRERVHCTKTTPLFIPCLSFTLSCQRGLTEPCVVPSFPVLSPSLPLTTLHCYLFTAYSSPLDSVRAASMPV